MYMDGGSLLSLRAILEEISPEVLDGGALDCDVVHAISVSVRWKKASLYILLFSLDRISTSGVVTGPKVFVTVNVQVMLYLE